MKPPACVEDLFSLYEQKGRDSYGESVSQLEHALQCASLARGASAPDELVVAALFHDIGHLIADTQGDETATLDRDDDRHDAIGARILARLIGPAVAQPVALHVTAKRWRSRRDADYLHTLSSASLLTLQAQGGPLNDAQCRRFEQNLGFADAVRLRTWDDAGKVPQLDAGSLRDYEAVVIALVDGR